MKRLLSLVLALVFGISTFSPMLLASAKSSDYNNLLDRFNQALDAGQTSSPTTRSNVPARVYVPGANTLMGHVTCAPETGCLLKDANKKFYRLLGTKLSKQILQAAVYDQVQVSGTLNKARTVLGNITQVTPMSGTSKAFVKTTPEMNPWNKVTYKGWIIKDAQGHVFLQRSDAYGKVMMNAGKPVEYRLLNGPNWRLAYQFIGKGIVSVTGLSLDSKWILRYDNSGISASY